MSPDSPVNPHSGSVTLGYASGVKVELRAALAHAKQTLPAVVYEVEQRGQVELTRRGRERTRAPRAKGTMVSTEDGLIAATAHVNGLTLVTVGMQNIAASEGLRFVDWTSA